MKSILFVVVFFFNGPADQKKMFYCNNFNLTYKNTAIDLVKPVSVNQRF